MSSSFETARAEFLATAATHVGPLGAALRDAGVPVDPSARLDTLLRLARARAPADHFVAGALMDFETVVRPALVDLVRALPDGLRPAFLPPVAQSLLEHFDRFTEVPITASWVQRVVICARRIYRRWRKADEGHVH